MDGMKKHLVIERLKSDDVCFADTIKRVREGESVPRLLHRMTNRPVTRLRRAVFLFVLAYNKTILSTHCFINITCLGIARFSVVR